MVLYSSIEKHHPYIIGMNLPFLFVSWCKIKVPKFLIKKMNYAFIDHYLDIDLCSRNYWISTLSFEQIRFFNKSPEER